MSKAQEQREKRAIEQMSMKVGFILKDFENKYMSAYTEWNMLGIQMKADEFPELKTFEDFKPLIGQSHEKTGIPSTCRHDRSGVVSHNDAYYAYSKVNRARVALSRRALTEFGFMSEAAQGYERKFNSLIAKLAKFGFEPNQIKVETVRNSGSELEFLISNDTMEVHARAIFVNGAIKAPHYRFITTKRNK